MKDWLIGRKLEGSTYRFSNLLLELLRDGNVGEKEASQLMNLLDYRVSFNSESFRECVLGKKCRIFEIVMSKLIDDVCVIAIFVVVCVVFLLFLLGFYLVFTLFSFCFHLVFEPFLTFSESL